MAHWAEIDENNFVVRVLVFGDDKTKNWIQKAFGGTWVETSYNGKIRKNYAGIGHTYDSDRDAFIPQKPLDSWVLNEETCRWEAPVAMPDDGKQYTWDEESVSWVEIPETSE